MEEIKEIRLMVKRVELWWIRIEFTITKIIILKE